MIKIKNCKFVNNELKEDKGDLYVNDDIKKALYNDDFFKKQIYCDCNHVQMRISNRGNSYFLSSYPNQGELHSSICHFGKFSKTLENGFKES